MKLAMTAMLALVAVALSAPVASVGEAPTSFAYAWLADGTVKSRETIVDGLESAPDAFLGLFKGENIGKMLVRL